ncbi:ABC transporter substrate-binding protein [Zavarzinia sp. CC-PAN008]|uniref:ABC transporter substrate-binding protein n=1 Tax=Zavarzinia sp. CC-PAN008 TaxID=3243332 RepID=UPI003F747E67
MTVTARRSWMKGALAALALLGLGHAPAHALDEVTFGTNWKAQAEHGGFYQAVATGLYEKYGLKVTIRQGGPQVNHPQLIAAGRIDFNMGGNGYDALNYASNGVPVVAVAAIFQKDPQVLIAHPGQGINTLADLKGRPIFVGSAGQLSYWQWLKVRYGFTDAQVKPYTYNPAPFLADITSAMQGYVTSEPFVIRQAGVEPVVFLLADNGFDTYSTTIEVRRDYMEANRDLVQRFVDASALGWKSYLHDDPAAANALIKAENPDMTDELLALSRQAMIDNGIVESGDALTQGIGAMSDARWASFVEAALKSGIYPADLDWKPYYTTEFVNKGVGVK